MKADKVDVDDLGRSEAIEMGSLHQEFVVDILEGRNIWSSGGDPEVMLVCELADRRQPSRSKVRNGDVGTFQQGVSKARLALAMI